MELKHHEFLKKLGVDQTPHSGRVLFEHLKGVHDLLRDWGNSEDVCNAGLYHSIYGTQNFKHRSLMDRRVLQALIGDYAELLVSNFATKDRPLFKSIMNERMRLELMEIEAANLIEQGSRGNWLHKLVRQRLSDGAKAALMHHMVTVQ